MANKREFKKYVSAVSTSIVSSMMAAYYDVAGINKEEVTAAVTDILVAGENAIMKTDVKYDKTACAFDNKHEYHKAERKFFKEVYAKVNKEFAEEINAAIKKFNAAVPEDVKKANIA